MNYWEYFEYLIIYTFYRKIKHFVMLPKCFGTDLNSTLQLNTWVKLGY